MKKLQNFLKALKPRLLVGAVMQRNSLYTLIIQRNKDLSYTAKVRLNYRNCFKRKLFGIYYVPHFLRPINNWDDKYYIGIAKNGNGQTSIYFNVILNMFIDFKRQYNITEKCNVAFYAA